MAYCRNNNEDDYDSTIQVRLIQPYVASAVATGVATYQLWRGVAPGVSSNDRSS